MHSNVLETGLKRYGVRSRRLSVSDWAGGRRQAWAAKPSNMTILVHYSTYMCKERDENKCTVDAIPCNATCVTRLENYIFDCK